jgi:hypothetical protein
LFPLGFTIDNWFEHAYYQVDWETDGHHLGYIPLDLHGNHSPMAHHCMLKETHIISYIQQAILELYGGIGIGLKTLLQLGMVARRYFLCKH